MQTKIESIILNVFIKLGDEVKVNVSADSRACGSYPKLENGLKGTVVGFKEYIDHRERTIHRMEETGTFLMRGMAIVQFEDGQQETMDAHSIAFVDQSLDEIRRTERSNRGGYDTDDSVLVIKRLGDLPETPFWEGDEVGIIFGSHKGLGQPVTECATPAALIVSRIDYARDSEEDTTYSVSGTYASGHSTGQVRCSARDIVLIKRGNLWLYHNGQRDAIVFTSIEDEIKFAQQLRTVDEVRNPLRNNYYLWTLSEVLTAVREGRVDAFSMQGGMFGARASIRAKRFEDRDLGERVRAKTIEGFIGTPNDVIDPEHDAYVDSMTRD